MGLVAEHVVIDALALNMVTMIGLALGVDYSLLVVSRFREELAAGQDVEDAVEAAIARAGRTVLFAGVALVDRDARRAADRARLAARLRDDRA